jgi:tetratricopeptide (TPR) repeat protein
MIRKSALVVFNLKWPPTVALAALLSVPFAHSAAQVQAKDPYLKEELLNHLKDASQLSKIAIKIAMESLIRSVERVGVEFELTKEIEEEFRGAKATNELIEAIRKNYRREYVARKRYDIGIRHYHQRLYEQAIKAFREAIEIYPDYVEALYYLGMAYHGLKRYEEVLPHLYKVTQLKADHAEAHYYLGMAYSGLNRYERAIQYLDKATKLKPNDADAYCHLGAAYFNSGREGEAIQPLKEAIRLKSDYDLAYYYLGVTYYYLSEFQKAIEALNQAVERRAFAEAYYQLARAHRAVDATGTKEAAIKTLKRAIELKSDYADAHFDLGSIYRDLGRLPEAIESLSRAIQYKTQQEAKAHHLLGLSYLDSGNKEAAQKECDILKRLGAEDRQGFALAEDLCMKLDR